MHISPLTDSSFFLSGSPFFQSLNSYTNGAYGSPYPPGPGPNTASYSGAYYVPGYTQSGYSTEVPSTYRSPGNSPTPVSRWIYSQQDCQTEAPPLRGQVPGYPSSQVNSFLMGEKCLLLNCKQWKIIYLH